MTIFEFLNLHQIDYSRVDHPPVFTCEEADALVPDLSGFQTKNLFLRDAKGRKHFLLTVPSSKSVDLKALSIALTVSGLSLASPERLKKYLDLEPGAVSLLSVINDRAHEVEVLIDQDLWTGEPILCHPLINTSTLVISKNSLEKFFEVTGHTPRIIPVAPRSMQ